MVARPGCSHTFQAMIVTTSLKERSSAFNEEAPRAAIDIASNGRTAQVEKPKLDQVRRLMPANQGTAVTALPSSVRLLTAASCCSWNHLPARGGRYRGGCRGGCIGGGGTSKPKSSSRYFLDGRKCGRSSLCAHRPRRAVGP